MSNFQREAQKHAGLIERRQRDGTACETCGGSGIVSYPPGPVKVGTPAPTCPACGGTGTKIALPPCKFTFDDERVYDGFAHGSTWNGFDNVAVTRETLDRIIEDTRADLLGADDEALKEALENFQLQPMENGLYSLGWGFATTIVE